MDRLNAIHGMYAKQISNGDMLYTLSLHIVEPALWVDRYGDIFRALLLFYKVASDTREWRKAGFHFPPQS